jgi:hypothetical protein
MTPSPRYIDTGDPSTLTFSVCSLVANQGKYDRLLASFARLGFTAENTEFLAADNRDSNRFDGYSWHKMLLAHARGRYVVFCHDDIELLDHGYDALRAQLAFLDGLDPTWLLAGVVGGVWRPRNSDVTRIAGAYVNDEGDLREHGRIPQRVESLDEFFIVMQRARPVVSSYDLSGFHHYGPDICLQAELLGGSAYVIDFRLRHHGTGKRGAAFRDSRRAFRRKYRQYFPDRVLHATTGRILLGDEPAEDG